jgi:hypothetical protein
MLGTHQNLADVRVVVAELPIVGVPPNNPPAGLFASVVDVVEAAGVVPSPNRGFGVADAVVVADAAGAVEPNKLVVGLLASAAVVEVVVEAAGVLPNSEDLGVVPRAAGAVPNNPPGLGVSVPVVAGVVVPATGVVPTPPKRGFGVAPAPVPMAGVVEAPNSPPLGAGVEVAPNRLGFAGSEALVVFVVFVVLGLPNENAGLDAFAVLALPPPKRPVPVDEVLGVVPAPD